MKKLKPIHYILISVIVILYSFIFSQVFISGADINSETLQRVDLASFKKIKIDTLMAHNVDPFRSKPVFIPKKKTRKKKKIVQKTVKRIVRLPQIKIIGESIHHNAKQYTIAYSGDIHFKAINETLVGIKIIKAKNDSLVVEYRNTLFTIPIGN